MQQSKKFLVLNAFASKPFGGNPAAVFLNASEIPESELQPIARQLNLIETVFVTPSTIPGVDFKLRYFTPLEELPIAGHPTVATWVALVHQGKVNPKERKIFKQETKVGVQELSIILNADVISVSMLQPNATFSEIINEVSDIAQAVGLKSDDFDLTSPVQGVNVGLGHLIIPVKTSAKLSAAKMDISKLTEVCSRHGMREAQLFTFEKVDAAMDIFTRNFTPREGLEDPACGNGNGALGAYLAETKFKSSSSFNLKAEQGHNVNMPSLIEIKMQRDQQGRAQISIAGSATLMLEGQFLV